MGIMDPPESRAGRLVIVVVHILRTPKSGVVVSSVFSTCARCANRTSDKSRTERRAIAASGTYPDDTSRQTQLVIFSAP
jgi:hypothetical protein